MKSGKLKIDSVEEAFKAKSLIKSAIICGSEGEVANDPSIGGGVYRGAFDIAYSGRKTDDLVYRNTVSFKLRSLFYMIHLCVFFYSVQSQRETIMTMIALSAADQLRQKQAWALSQIVTIASPSIDNTFLTERRVSYTDILVRNAFKSYRNVSLFNQD